MQGQATVASPRCRAQLVLRHILVLLVACTAGAGTASPQTPAATAPPAGRPGGNATAAETPYWIENAELEAVRRPSADAATPARPGSAQSQADAGATRGEVFDSADYQLLLLVGPTWEEALVLSLGSGDVRAFSTGDVVGRDGRPGRVDPTAGRSVASFVSHPDGRITFETADHEYAIEPAAPLLGEIPLATLLARQPTYERRARSYTPDPAALGRLAGIAEDVEIVAFFGTWCQICKKHLPALLSTIDHAGNPHLKLRLIAVNEDATEPADWIEACGAGYATPTFIVRVDQAEIGRIEEEPHVSVEADLAEILSRAQQH